MALSVGTQLGPYEILALIGAGGMGEVYRARDSRLGRDVAIKISNERFSDRFEREVRAVAALNHPNICTLYDVGPNYLVMEYIEGIPLEGPFSSERAVALARQIVSALVEAHRKGIVHRDLKPANILLTANGIKLLDFGLAKHQQQTEPSDETMSQTQAGIIMGTAAYMSPEQASGKPADARSDIFSFGVVLYELLSGRQAFQGDTSVARLAAVLHQEPEPLHAEPSLVRLLTRCLRKSPADRFQNAAELSAALDAVDVRAAAQGSIAVLPFTNMSADKENEYFSDGLAEEIINVLAHISGLKVIARTSAFAFRDKEQDLRKIAEALDVRTILQGSVRRSGSRIRVTAQLINPADGSHLWSERYDRELADVFAIQDEIAQAIASALELRLALPAQSRRYIPKLPAYEAYLKARFHQWKLTPESMARAREYYEQAIALDPGYPLPYAELGAFFSMLATFGMLPAREALPLARASALRALECDPSLPEAHTVLGIVAGQYDYDWRECERRFLLAMARDPIAPTARLYYGISYLYYVGRALDAAKEIARALEDDPLNLFWRQALGFCLMAAAGREDEAATEFRSILEIDEAYHLAYSHLCVVAISRGQLTEAQTLIERAYALAPWLAGNSGLRAGLFVRTGDASRVPETLQRLGDGQGYGTALGFMLFYLVCQKTEKAAEWAKKAMAQRDPAGLYFLWGPLARDLRSSHHWPELAALMNQPEAVQDSGETTI